MTSRGALAAARAISQECLATRARRLERTVTRLYEDALRPHGLSGPQLSMLVAIVLTGEVQPKTLSTILDLDKSTLSRNIALMVDNEWIESRRSGRAQLLRVTDTGAALLERALPAWRHAQRQARALLPPHAVETLSLLEGPGSRSANR